MGCVVWGCFGFHLHHLRRCGLFASFIAYVVVSFLGVSMFRFVCKHRHQQPNNNDNRDMKHDTNETKNNDTNKETLRKFF